jgi:hypothetical protein
MGTKMGSLGTRRLAELGAVRFADLQDEATDRNIPGSRAVPGFHREGPRRMVP